MSRSSDGADEAAASTLSIVGIRSFRSYFPKRSDDIKITLKQAEASSDDIRLKSYIMTDNESRTKDRRPGAQNAPPRIGNVRKIAVKNATVSVPFSARASSQRIANTSTRRTSRQIFTTRPDGRLTMDSFPTFNAFQPLEKRSSAQKADWTFNESELVTSRASLEEQVLPDGKHNTGFLGLYMTRNSQQPEPSPLRTAPIVNDFVVAARNISSKNIKGSVIDIHERAFRSAWRIPQNHTNKKSIVREEDELSLIKGGDYEYKGNRQIRIVPNAAWKQHLRQWWWLYLVGFLIVATAVLVPIFILVVPKLPQQSINTSVVSMTSLTVSAPAESSFRLSARAQIQQNNLVTLPFQLDPFSISLAVSIASATTRPFLTTSTSGISVSDTADFNLTESSTLTNQTESSSVLVAALWEETFQLHMSGQTTAHMPSLSNSAVAFSKTVNVKGLNKFKGFTISNVRKLAATQPDGSNVAGNATIPNTTVMAIEFGNMTFNVFVQSTNVGSLSLENVSLVPGNNTMPFTANLDLSKFLAGLDVASGTIDVVFSGNSTIYNGRHVTYYEEALENVVIKSSINAEQFVYHSAGVANI